MLEESECAAWLSGRRRIRSARAISHRDYAKSAQIMKLGYEAAGSRARLLERLLSTMRIAGASAAAQALKRSDIPVPQFIEVEERMRTKSPTSLAT